MARFGWAAIATLWIGSAIAVAVILGKAEADAADDAAAARYTFVALVSDHTAALIADPPEESRIALRFVDTPDDVVYLLGEPAIAGVILDSTTASRVHLDALTDAYRRGKVIAAFEIRPTQVLRGACVDNPPPCRGDASAVLHEDEPAIAYSFRAGPSSGGEGETVVHPYLPSSFFGILRLRTQTAMGVPHVPESPAGSR